MSLKLPLLKIMHKLALLKIMHLKLTDLVCRALVSTSFDSTARVTLIAGKKKNGLLFVDLPSVIHYSYLNLKLRNTSISESLLFMDSILTGMSMWFVVLVLLLSLVYYFMTNQRTF